ncbi:MAG: imidazole glycerol phosphate synthase subunit HisF [Betaproteobacteria bacterium]|nr:imidazole glycerol phosphate synthase subunit HisF [Betaproteobacteria bacterium]
MLKPRLIGIVLVRDGIAVQSIGFNRYLPLGQPTIAVEYLDRWGVDEIVLLDIQAGPAQRSLDPGVVRQCAELCRTPLTVGGGVRDMASASALLAAGADKICVNSAAHSDPSLVGDLSMRFGEQCVVFSVDVKKHSADWNAYASGGKSSISAALDEILAHAQKSGAGEILLNSIDRDGSRLGYDLELIRHCAGRVSIPLIAAGGAGHPRHFNEALEAGASAVAAANMLHYTEHSVIVAKRHMQTAGRAMRIDTPAGYPCVGHLDSGRLAMFDETRLDAARFHRLP